MASPTALRYEHFRNPACQIISRPIQRARSIGTRSSVPLFQGQTKLPRCLLYLRRLLQGQKIQLDRRNFSVTLNLLSFFWHFERLLSLLCRSFSVASDFGPEVIQKNILK